ncbi:hypothetical protein [Curtobacterium sp. VKM Ac-1395]|uniref:hypothetical protein n=1 Tax=Curtobacterium sp. VKM Ac-1395 TaxID=2783815 RepID=UPI00188A03EC|nr:hypothetical protein [Curtobacterium sp. VKM Ac-1395]MBF4590652.1 hypothetical protein [Curtobacterium sp. VKM Ac-1395]
MTPRLVGAAVVVAAASAVVLARRRRPRSAPGTGAASAPRSGWLAVTVTVARDVDDVLPAGRTPGPLARFGDAVELEARIAPGDKGTELRARFRQGASRAAAGDRDRGRLRAALREAKQLIEVGEVLRVDPVPHGRRTATPTGALVELATARSNEEGTL